MGVPTSEKGKDVLKALFTPSEVTMSKAKVWLPAGRAVYAAMVVRSTEVPPPAFGIETTPEPSIWSSYPAVRVRSYGVPSVFWVGLVHDRVLGL